MSVIDIGLVLLCGGGCCMALVLVVAAVIGMVWMGSGPESPEDARRELVRMVQDFHPPRDSDHEPSTTELATTNEVGRLLVRGKPAEAVEVLDKAFETARPEAKGDLLNQKGGALWMLDRFEEARDAYAEQVALDPSDLTALGNLVEGEGKVGTTGVFLTAVAQWRSAGGKPSDEERFEALIEALKAPAE